MAGGLLLRRRLRAMALVQRARLPLPLRLRSLQRLLEMSGLAGGG